MQTAAADRINPSSTLILDVRSPEEYVRSHIPGSVLHPLEELDRDAVRTISGDKRPIVLVCERGSRAQEAARCLEEAGLANASVLEGGLEAWVRSGGAIRRSGARLSLERQIRIGAGLMVLLGFALAYLLSPGWLALSIFVGVGLIFAGATGFCGMGVILARAPWNRAGSGRASPGNPGGCSRDP